MPKHKPGPGRPHLGRRHAVLTRLPEKVAEVALAAFGSDEAGNATSGILGSRFRSDRFHVSRRIPFSSATKYSALTMTVGGEDSSWVLGAPERVLEAHPEELARATELAASGLRTLALARAVDPLPAEVHTPLTGTRVEPAVLVLLAETVRPEAHETLRRLGIDGAHRREEHPRMRGEWAGEDLGHGVDRTRAHVLEGGEAGRQPRR